jgi:hypothetical protein
MLARLVVLAMCVAYAMVRLAPVRTRMLVCPVAEWQSLTMFSALEIVLCGGRRDGRFGLCVSVWMQAQDCSTSPTASNVCPGYCPPGSFSLLGKCTKYAYYSVREMPKGMLPVVVQRIRLT